MQRGDVIPQRHFTDDRHHTQRSKIYKITSELLKEGAMNALPNSAA